MFSSNRIIINLYHSSYELAPFQIGDLYSILFGWEGVDQLAFTNITVGTTQHSYQFTKNEVRISSVNVIKSTGNCGFAHICKEILNEKLFFCVL